MYKVWHCDYCTDPIGSPKEAEKHEKECALNPKTKNCMTCKDFRRYNISKCIQNIENNENIFKKRLSCTKWSVISTSQSN
jgi:hypothetical protein